MHLQVKYNIINYVYPELQNLYKWLEVEFHPLKLASRVQGSLQFLETKEELKQYVSALQDITITRLLKQVRFFFGGTKASLIQGAVKNTCWRRSNLWTQKPPSRPAVFLQSEQNKVFVNPADTKPFICPWGLESWLVAPPPPKKKKQNKPADMSIDVRDILCSDHLPSRRYQDSCLVLPWYQ